MIAGTNINESLDAILYSLYISDDGAGNYYAGYAFSNDIAGDFWPGAEQGTFDAQGGLNFGFEYPTSVSPSELYLGSDVIVEHRNLEADIIGDITGSFPFSIESARIEDQSWDIWSFGGVGSVSSILSDDWESILGSGEIGDYEDSYLIWHINGNTAADSKLKGTISGRHLRVNSLVISDLGGLTIDTGDFIGEYEDGTWHGIGAGIGSIEQDLQFGGYFNGSFVEYGEGLGNENGSVNAIMGSTDSIWAGTAPIVVMGQYSNPEGQNLWIDGGDFTAFTSDGARLLGVIGGIGNEDSSLKAGLLAFYIRRYGASEYRAGYVLSNDMVGNHYDDGDGEGLFELDGTIDYYMDIPTSYAPADIESALEESSHNLGLIEGGALDGYMNFDFTNIEDQNWGLFYGGAGGTFETLLGSGWTASIGGKGYSSVSYDLESYFMGEVTGDPWTNNEFLADINGQYLSTGSLGTFSGDMLGSYDISTSSWEALIFGVGNEMEQLTSSGMLIANFQNQDTAYYGFEGLIGLRDNIWDGGAAFVSMGDFWASGADDFIWYGDPKSFYSYDYEWSHGEGRYATFEEEQGYYGSFVGLSVGRGADGYLDGILYSLYIDPDGNAGVAYDNNLSGMYDDDIEMYQLAGYLGLDTPKASEIVNIEDLYDSLTWNDVVGNPISGDFAGGGDISLEGFSSTLININYEEWGIFEFHGAGTYEGNNSDSWTVSGMIGLTDSNSMGLTTNGSWLGEMTGSRWSEYLVDGQLNAIRILLNEDGTLSGQTITEAEVIGNYVEVEGEFGTFQVASAGEWVEVDSLLDLSGQYDDITEMPGLNIPITEVYTSFLSGTGSFSNESFMSATMNMNFYVNNDVYDYISDGIWAATISGNYETPTTPTWSVDVTGDLISDQTEGVVGTVNAQLTGTSWADGFWQAHVSGITSTDITINGIAAGTYSGGTEGGSFTGAGTGTYQTP